MKNWLADAPPADLAAVRSWITTLPTRALAALRADLVKAAERQPRYQRFAWSPGDLQITAAKYNEVHDPDGRFGESGTRSERIAETQRTAEASDAKYGPVAARTFAELPLEQQRALEEIKSGSDVNDALRGTLAGQNEPDRPHALAQLPALDAAMRGAPPLTEDTVVYRGLVSYPDAHDPSSEQATQWIGAMKVGATVVDQGYPSTSLSRGVAIGHALGSEHGVVMRITVPAGSRAWYLDDHVTIGGTWNESEMLLPRGGSFTITGREGDVIDATYQQAFGFKAAKPRRLTIRSGKGREERLAPIVARVTAAFRALVKDYQPSANKYSEDQERDDHGRFADEGRGGGAEHFTRGSIGAASIAAIQTAEAARLPADWRTVSAAEAAQRVTAAMGTKISPDLVSHVQAEPFREAMYQLTQMHEQFPTVKITELTYVSPAEVARMGGGDTSQAATTDNADPRSSLQANGTVTIALASAAWGQGAPSINLYQPDSLWHPNGCSTAAGVITHEFGHAVMADAQHDHPAALMDMFLHGGFPNGSISAYGASGAPDPHEEFAERFSASYTPSSTETGDPKAVALRDWLVKVGETKKGVAADLTKYNDNHDERGRFADADGGGAGTRPAISDHTRRTLDWHEGDPKPVRVDQRYDRHTRSWVTSARDANEYQVGVAAYDGTRADAAASKASYERMVGEIAGATADLAKYSPDQDRDERGRFADEGGGAREARDAMVGGRLVKPDIAAAIRGGEQMRAALAGTPGWRMNGAAVLPQYVQGLAGMAKMMSQEFPVIASTYPVDLHSMPMEDGTVEARTADFGAVQEIDPSQGNPNDTLTGEHAVMQLNLGNWASDHVAQQMAMDQAHGWSAPGATTPESILTHEYAHVVDQWTGDKGTALIEKLVRDGGVTRLIAGYGRTSAAESFAEAFKAVYYTDKSLWTPDVEAVSNFIKDVQSGKIGHAYGPDERRVKMLVKWTTQPGVPVVGPGFANAAMLILAGGFQDATQTGYDAGWDDVWDDYPGGEDYGSETADDSEDVGTVEEEGGEDIDEDEPWTDTAGGGYADDLQRPQEPRDPRPPREDPDLEQREQALLENVRGRLASLGAALAAGVLTEPALAAILGQYAAGLNVAYEQGLSDALHASGDVVQVAWQSQGDTEVCDLCDERDGQTWGLDEDYPFPGEGGYGEVCDGGPNCRCDLEYTVVPSDEMTAVATGDLTKLTTGELARIRAHLARTARKYNEVHDADGRFGEGDGGVHKAAVDWASGNSHEVRSALAHANEIEITRVYGDSPAQEAALAAGTALVNAVNASAPTDEPLYRGIGIRSEADYAAFQAAFTEGKTVDLNLSSWTNDRAFAEQFAANAWGTHGEPGESNRMAMPPAHQIVFRLEPGAHALDISAQTNEAQNTEAQYDERLTAGRFSVGPVEHSVTYRADRTRDVVTLRQISTLPAPKLVGAKMDPIAGKAKFLVWLEALLDERMAPTAPAQKYNENHDELGRFADGDGGGGSEAVPIADVHELEDDATVPYVGGTSPDHDRVTALKAQAAATVAAGINTPERIAALAASPILGAFIVGGAGYASPEDAARLTALGREWQNATPDERTAMLASADLRTALAAGYIQGWAYTASDNNAMALAVQMAAAKEFGLPDTASARGAAGSEIATRILGQSEPGLRALVRSTYEGTQRGLAAAGVKYVTVARGINTRPPSVPTREDIPGIRVMRDDTWSGRVTTNPLSSWTVDKATARGFGAYLLSTRVPASRVFSTAVYGPGASVESEVVLLGGNLNVTVTKAWL